MDKDIVRAFLWQEVIRLGFVPEKREFWLKEYNQSLKDFWGMESYPRPPQKNKRSITSSIDSNAEFAYEYHIVTYNTFSVRLMTLSSGKSGLMWMHDMDSSYYTPNLGNILPSNSADANRVKIVQEFKKDDVESVIDSLLIHPTPHQHIEWPIDDHGIRIGGGLTNAYLYLFHLRVQFCPDENRKRAERDRLVNLFLESIQKNEIIAPRELMKIPE